MFKFDFRWISHFNFISFKFERKFLILGDEIIKTQKNVKIKSQKTLTFSKNKTQKPNSKVTFKYLTQFNPTSSAFRDHIIDLNSFLQLP